MPEPIAADRHEDDWTRSRPRRSVEVGEDTPDGGSRASSSTSALRRGLHAAMALLVLAILLAAATTASYVLWRRDPNVVLENHLIEWTQASLLAMAALIHIARLRTLSDTVLRLGRIGLALFCFSLVLRELDLHKLGTSVAWQIAEVGLRCVMIVAWLIFAGVAIRSAPVIRARLRGVALSPCMLLTFFGGVFYLLSWPFDQFEPDIGALSAMFLEETLQLNGAILLFAAPWTALRRRQGALSEPATKKGPETLNSSSCPSARSTDSAPPPAARDDQGRATRGE